jgi:hypothetical protein
MRVLLNTDAKLNELVSQRIRETVAHCAQAHPQAIERRLQELDREWDTDRVMETMSSVVMLAGVGLAAAVNAWWLLLSAAAGACLLTHGLFGWDPLLPLYRRWGIRTSLEIDYERYALKALRGDFQKLACITTPEDRDAIARLEGEGGPALDVVAAGEGVVVEEVLAAARK